MGRFTEKYTDGSQYGLLSLDLSNAFNIVSRAAFLKGVDEHFPTLLPWVSYCYGGEPAYLWTGENFLLSVTGVQQGDPLRPLLLAIALRPVTLELRKRLQISSSSEVNGTPDVFNVWYLDYGYIVANHEQLRSVLDYLLSNDVKNRGPHLNLAKCEVWWPKEPPRDFQTACPDAVPQKYVEGTLILNAPLGSDHFMNMNTHECEAHIFCESSILAISFRKGCRFRKQTGGL